MPLAFSAVTVKLKGVPATTLDGAEMTNWVAVDAGVCGTKATPRKASFVAAVISVLAVPDTELPNPVESVNLYTVPVSPKVPLVVA